MSRRPAVTSQRTAPITIVCGDLGSSDCGVGASEATYLRGLDIEWVDPAALWPALASLLRGRKASARTVMVYPTRSTVRAPATFLTFALALVLRPGRVHWHLHEFAIFRTRRWVLSWLLLWSGGSVVVSTETEASAVRRAFGGRVGRRVVVHTIPPPSGSPVLVSEMDHVQPPIVGVFGRARDDKGTAQIVELLRHLPSEHSCFETVGRGWEQIDWPADIRARFTVVHHGLVDGADLANVLRRWALALAPFRDGATDKRTSLRTLLAAGVPTVSPVERPQDLTLDVPHHLRAAPSDSAGGPAVSDSARVDGVRAVAAFERDAIDRLRSFACGDAVPAA